MLTKSRKIRPMLLEYIYSGPQYQQYWIYWDEPPYEENADVTDDDARPYDNSF